MHACTSLRWCLNACKEKENCKITREILKIFELIELDKRKDNTLQSSLRRNFLYIQIMRTIYRKSFYQWQYIEKFEIDQILECFILELSSEVQVFESFELSTYLQGKFFLNICKKCDGFVPSHDSWYEYSYMSRIEIKPGENISQNLHEFYNSPKGYLLDKHLKKCDCLVPAPEKTWEYSRRNRLRIVYLRNESKERSPVPRTITVAAEKYELSAFMMFSEAGTLASCVKYGQNWFQIESSIISTKLNIEAILEQGEKVFLCFYENLQ